VKNANQIKEIVKEKYGQIAGQSLNTCGCGCDCKDSTETLESLSLRENYKNIDGYVPESDLGLGCGLPTEYAGIKQGDTVVDLGSGAGNDAFIARAIVGDTGHIIGIDMTQKMINKANWHNKKLGYNNVEFKLGEIEALPLENNNVDVIVSNCVLNLVPDKNKAFAEIYRVLKPGGHFCVSDIVVNGNLPEKLQKKAEMYVGCVAGAVSQNEYLNIIKKTGFDNITIHSAKKVQLSAEILEKYLTSDEVEAYLSSNIGIISITVTAYKK